jgi:hypothetical protein
MLHNIHKVIYELMLVPSKLELTPVEKRPS